MNTQWYLEQIVSQLQDANGTLERIAGAVLYPEQKAHCGDGCSQADSPCDNPATTCQPFYAHCPDGFICAVRSEDGTFVDGCRDELYARDRAALLNRIVNRCVHCALRCTSRNGQDHPVAGDCEPNTSGCRAVCEYRR